jgi:hypothetical protein
MGNQKMMMNNPQKSRRVPSIIRAVLLYLHTDIGSERACVLVEGKSDARLYPKFFKDFQTRVIVIKSGGKSNMFEALAILADNTKQAIGICDADFYHLDKSYPVLDNIFITDYHDIEKTMMYFNRSGDAILQMVLPETAFIGYTRWYNEKNTCNFKFKKVDVGVVFKVSNGKPKLDNEKYLSELNNVSKNKTMTITTEEIAKFIGLYKTEDYFNLCNGHDVMLGITLILGNNSTLEEYQQSLQDSFTLEFFMQTNLYKSILAWQTINGFDILKTETEALNG